MRVYETKDYNTFQLISENRPVDYRKIERMRKQIRKKNLISSYIINVNSKKESSNRYGMDGTKYAIVDGQHRFISCKMENKKIYFLVNDELTLDDIPKAASLQNSWKITDYLHHYAERGFDEYKAFNGYMTKNQFPPSTTMMILSGSRGTHISTHLKNGELKCTASWKLANDFADGIDEMSHHVKFARNARFIEAFWTMFKHKQYKHPKMMAKMEYMSTQVKKCADRESFLEVLSYVYNYNSRTKVRFVIGEK